MARMGHVPSMSNKVVTLFLIMQWKKGGKGQGFVARGDKNKLNI
jgi:hypothetical protein